MAVEAGEAGALGEAMLELAAGRLPALETRASHAAAWQRVEAALAQHRARMLWQPGAAGAEPAFVYAFEAAKSALRAMSPGDSQRPAVNVMLVDDLVSLAQAIGTRRAGPSPPSGRDVAGHAEATFLAWQLVDLVELPREERAQLVLRLLSQAPPPRGLPRALTELRECADALAQAAPLESGAARLDLSRAWLFLGDVERALPTARAVRKQVSEERMERSRAGADLRLMAGVQEAQALAATGEGAAAVRLLAELESVAEEHAPTVVPALRLRRADALLSAGRPDECLALLDDREIRAGNAVSLPAWLDLLTARARRAVGEPELARDRLERALSSAEDGDPETEWRIRAQLAELCEESGDVGTAREHLGRAVALIEAFRGSSLGYRLDSTVLRERMPVYRHTIRLAVTAGDAPGAAQLIEAVKQRGFDALFGRERMSARDAAASEELRALNAELDALQYESFRVSALDLDQAGRFQALQSRRRDLLEQVTLHETRVRRAAAEDVTAFVRSGRSALTLFFDEPRATVVAALHDAHGVDVATCALSPATSGALTRYRDNLTEPKPVGELFDPDALSLHADDLVPEGILARAVQASSLIIAPHGPLHLLPWPSLSFSGRRLIERLPVGVVPSLGIAIALDDRPLADAPRAALVGAPAGATAPELPDLPMAGLELDDLAELYDGDAERLLAPPAVREGGTQAAFFTQAQLPDAQGHILHVACHGAADAEDPPGAGLMLGGGKVDVSELSRLSVAYGEVVLSACASGWRPLRAAGVDLLGDDAVSLAGALISAGAGSVLVSIPPAFDVQTQELMTVYHRLRFDGQRPMEALREAQLEALAAGSPAHTVTGFVVYGCR